MWESVTAAHQWLLKTSQWMNLNSWGEWRTGGGRMDLEGQEGGLMVAAPQILILSTFSDPFGIAASIAPLRVSNVPLFRETSGTAATTTAGCSMCSGGVAVLSVYKEDKTGLYNTETSRLVNWIWGSEWLKYQKLCLV